MVRQHFADVYAARPDQQRPVYRVQPGDFSNHSIPFGLLIGEYAIAQFAALAPPVGRNRHHRQPVNVSELRRSFAGSAGHSRQLSE
jgi:hypothetical protein